MTEPKTPGPGGKQPPSRTEAPTPSEASAAATDRELLSRLVDLTASVKQLAERPGYPPPAEPAPDPAASGRRAAQFGYGLLGELMGRRRSAGFGEPVFTTPRVHARRDPKGVITFTNDLHGATVAEVQAPGTKEVATITDSRVQLTSIADTTPIEFIVLLTAESGEPVAIGPSFPALYTTPQTR